MTDHDRIRKERAQSCDRTNLDSLSDAIRGLQSTDDPSLVPLHDELMECYQKLKAALKLYRVSLLIPNTRQAMSGYIFAKSEEDAKKIFNIYIGLNDEGQKTLVVDEVPMEEGLVAMNHNDRDVLLKYFPRR